ncbi:hypothetical protein D3C86_1069300 [compost metagenome]
MSVGRCSLAWQWKRLERHYLRRVGSGLNTVVVLGVWSESRKFHVVVKIVARIPGIGKNPIGTRSRVGQRIWSAAVFHDRLRIAFCFPVDIDRTGGRRLQVGR